MRAIQLCRAGLAAIVLFVSVSGSAQNTLGYDPSADPFALLSAARSEAAAEDKLILVVAGGEWCIWCHYLSAFLTDNPGISKALRDTFVVVKAYIGDETDNDAFFSTLPAAAGYPHFWVLDADGEVLQSQDTLPLEDGDKSYDNREFIAFIDNWKQAR